jgi:uncharacterized protein YegJ (DUF2314 family)
MEGPVFDWLKRECLLRGVVFFRGTIPPTAANFTRLAAAGITVREESPHDDERWRLALDHPQWGKAVLACQRDFVPIPDSIINVSWLSDTDKAEARLGESAVSVTVDGAGENALRERKNLLRFLHAASGGEGVAVLDVVSQRIWSRADLEDEMRHDADLDVEGLYTVHAVMDDRENDPGGEGQTVWFHTHGLAEFGLLDFDLVQPGPGVSCHQATELIRVIAGNILEGDASPDSGSFTIGYPDADAELVDINAFLKNARGHGADLLRAMFDEDQGVDDDFNSDHLRHHAVVCEPRQSGLLKNLLGANQPNPARFPWEEDGIAMMYFSSDMTEVMAARARATYGVLRDMAAEFRAFEFPVLAKLGYEVDDDDEGGREHLWFELHDLHDATIDATLLNEPFNIAAMHEGDRGRHPVDRFTDWVIYTPFGQINPRSFTAARSVREDPEAAKAAMQDDEA